MRSLSLLFAFIMSILLSGCFEDGFDQSNEPEKPTLTYDATTLETPFYTAGTSGAPNIDWNGEQGSLSLASSIEGLDINTTTGVLSWSNLLDIGDYNIQVIASNSAGQTVVNMVLNCKFQGGFTGNYDGASFYELEFNEDGTLIVRANNESNPDTGEGTWTLKDNNIVIGYYSYNANEDYTLIGNLSITASSCTYSGDYYPGDDPEGTGTANGTFVTVLQ